MQIGRRRSQATRAGGLRHTFRAERKVFDLQWSVGFKTDDVTAVAQVKKRAFARADRAALQAVLLEIDWAEVFAVTAVLPQDVERRLAFALEIDLAEDVAAVFTPDRTLPRSEESSFVFGAKYSHFGSSLQRQVTVQVVLGTKHVMMPGEIQTYR